MSNLREELKSRRDKSENDIMIKYHKGIPTIVCSKNVQSPLYFTLKFTIKTLEV